MPYLEKGSMSIASLGRIITMDGTISLKSIERDYLPFASNVQIGELGVLNLYQLPKLECIIGVDNSVAITRPKRARVQFRLDLDNTFKFNCEHSFRNTIQVESVALEERYRCYGITSAIYRAVADQGYTVVSDNTQYEPAQGMWKKLAEEQGVFVVDMVDGPVKSESNALLEYDGASIPDFLIWSSGSDYSGFDKVLILTPENARRA